MARQVHIVMTCDVCELASAKKEGQPFVIQLGTLKPREIILCEAHEKKLLTPLAELLPDLPTVDALASVTKGKRASGPRLPPLSVDPEAPITCKVCKKQLKNVATLATHVRSQHDLSFRDYRVQHLMK